MHSHHAHSGQFCKHAVGTLKEVVQTAIDSGFSVFGLSEHVPRYRRADLYPEEQSLSIEDLSGAFDAYVVEAHRIRSGLPKEGRDRTSFLIGLETDYITEIDLERLSALLAKHGDSIEYIIGSVHHVAEYPIDYGKELFDEAAASISMTENSVSGAGNNEIPNDGADGTHNLPMFISHYLDQQYTLLTRFQPEIIGHFDLFRLYYPSYTLSQSSTPELWEKMTRNINYAVGYGALFEINAAAFRKGWSQAYPGKEIAELILSLGGRFALSDDSHGPPFVALNYSRLRTYAKDVLKLEEIWHLEKIDGEERNAGGRKTRAVKWSDQSGNGRGWWEDEFWDRCITRL